MTMLIITITNPLLVLSFKADNSLGSTIPTEIGLLSKLEQLELGNNKLIGTYPSEIGECDVLVRLDLKCNFLAGKIPRSYCHWDRFVQFRADRSYEFSIHRATCPTSIQFLTKDLVLPVILAGLPVFGILVGGVLFSSIALLFLAVCLV